VVSLISSITNNAGTMKHRTAIIASLIFTGFGLLLSGYLSYYSLFKSGCHKGFLPFLNCGSNPVNFWGVPQCVVGFVMYFIVAVLAVAGLYAASKKNIIKWLFGFGILGSLFSASLSVYELWFQKPHPTQLPACVYGFFFYLGILIVNAVALRSPTVQPQEPPQSNQP